MRAVVASLFAVAMLLGVVSVTPVVAAPPDDVAAYCRSVYPQVQFQVRCISLEKAAAGRVARAGAGGDPDAFNRCQGTSASWAEMERCLAESTRAAAAAATGAAGGAMSRAPGQPADPGVSRPHQSGAPPAGPARPAAPGTATAPGAAGAPSPSTVILGPQATPTPPSERNRQTRTISEADAERQLRGVLEREGQTAARCTKKQYGPGWVTICE